MTSKAVIRFTTVYEKLDMIEKDIKEVLEDISSGHDDSFSNSCKLDRALQMFNLHQGLLEYAKEKHGVDLDEIWDNYYINERGYKTEEILK